MFLLDTNVVSELRRPESRNRSFQDWAAAVSDDDLFVSVVTVLELQYGAELKSRRDATQGAMLLAWLDGVVVPRFAGRTLPIDLAVARRTASLHVPDRRPERDAFIAATALVHAMTVVTRNVRDFAPLGVPVLNPWEPRAG